MKKPQILIISLTFLLCSQIISGQQWLKSSKEEKRTKIKSNFYEIQKEFNDYWNPYQVKNGKYKSKSGKQVKAPGWKQFKRWEWYMEPRVHPGTGEFPKTSAQLELQKYRAKNSKSKNNLEDSSSWTSLGPNSSDGGYAGVGRVNCVAFHPTDNNTYWVGTPAGGLWKTEDDGLNWIPLTDNIGSIGVSSIIIPSDYASSNTIYIGTGDRDSFDTRSIGVLKSTNGGNTWDTTGLTFSVTSSSMVFKMLLNPTNDNHIIATTNSGVYSTTDGGTNWMLINNSVSSLCDIEAKPGDFSTLYGSSKYGDVFKSVDSGNTWVKKMNSDGGKTMIAVSSDDDKRIYAVVGNDGLDKIYKSVDGGETFQVVLEGSTLNLLGWDADGQDEGGQDWYDLTIEASPSNADILLVGGINTWRSLDAGATWNIVTHWYGAEGNQSVHADKHALVYRANGDLFEGNDGGVYKSSNDGLNFIDKSNGIINSQMYKLGVSQSEKGTVLTGLQDNGSKLNDKNSWRDVKGGDGMECIIDYSNADVQYATYVYGQITRTLTRWNGGSSNINENIGDGSLKGAWVAPYIMDPKDPNTLYVGYDDVWKTTNKGDTFKKISTMTTGGNLRSMAIAPSDSNYLYVADQSTLLYTKNGGESWSDITGTLPVESNSITSILVDYHHPEKLWVTMGQYNGNRIFESNDSGGTWTNISAGLPNIPILSVVQRKLNKVNQLYIGSDVGVYVKSEDENWTLFSTGLPNVIVSELEIYYDKLNPNNSKLIAATYGRGLWESPLLTVSGGPFTYVPDDYFEQTLIDLGFDDVLDDYVLTSNIDEVKELNLTSEASTNLTGIEDFKNLQILRLNNYNNLKSVDISKNVNLADLFISSTSLPVLDVRNNLSLTSLTINNSLLTSLDLSKNSLLTAVDCQNNQLKELNIKNGNNINFSNFNAKNNPDLECINVDSITWSETNWVNIDTQISFSENGCLSGDVTFIPDDNFEQVLIDLGLDESLNDYVLTSNIETLTNLNLEAKGIKDLTGIESFIGLTELNCYNNQISHIDLTNNTSLIKLIVWANKLTSLDISKNIALQYLDCDTNQIEELDVSNNTALTHLYTLNNNLESLNVKNGNNTILTTFDSRNNVNLECISVDNETWSYNNWTAIDSHAKFNEKGCTVVKLTNIPDDNFEQALIDLGIDDVLDDKVLTSSINSLGSLDVSGKNISDLTGISDFVKLSELNCSNNQLTVLDVSMNVELANLNSTSNLLSCILVNSIQLISIPVNWKKDDGSVYSLDCLDDDNDGVVNNLDECPNTTVGEVVDKDGCSQSQLDDDNDGVSNNIDECPNTPLEEESDEKGCSQSQLDDDGDGIMNNVDDCPDTTLGEQVDEKGCSLSQIDYDGDGVLNNLDECANTPLGEQVDEKGCSQSQIDDDNDGVMNNVDECSNTPLGEQVDEKGCSQSQIDDDNDGIMNNVDECSNTPIGEQVDGKGCSQSQLDDDNDGVMNDIDKCPNTIVGVNVNENGCFFLPANNFTIEIENETCPGKNNGHIFISAVENYNYAVEIIGEKYNFSNTQTIENLSPGLYDICITVSVDEYFKQCFTIIIDEGIAVSGKSVLNSNNTEIEILKGTPPFSIFINGNKISETNASVFNIDAKSGDYVEVKTAVLCEGIYSETINSKMPLLAYPNPTNGVFELKLPILLNEVKVEIFTINSQLVSKGMYPVNNGKVEINIEDLPASIYIVKVYLEQPKSVKIIKN